jgi:mono/diheme cytochrome c family protein
MSPGKNRSVTLTLPLLLSAALLTACGGGEATTAEEGPAASGAEAAPAGATFTVADAAEWATLTDAGKATFDASCGACHPGGDADLGPTLKAIAWDSAKMKVQIREGSKRMRPVMESRLADADLKGLFVYLSTLGAVSDVQQP